MSPEGNINLCYTNSATEGNCIYYVTVHCIYYVTLMKITSYLEIESKGRF